MWFFNRKKKWENINAHSKREFLSILESYVQRASSQVIAKLESAKGILNEQGSSSSKELVKLDAEIRQQLLGLSEEITAGQDSAALIKLDDIIEKLHARAPHCMDNSSFMTERDRKKAEKAETARRHVLGKSGVPTEDKLYSPDRLIEIMVAKANDQLKALKEEKDKLFSQLEADPEDRALLFNWDTIKLRIESKEQQLDMLQDAGYRAVLTDCVRKLTEEQKKLITTRGVTDEQFDLLMQDYGKMVEKQNADRARTEEAANAFYAGGQKQAAAAPAAQAATSRRSALDDPEFTAMREKKAGAASAAQAAAPSAQAAPSRRSALDDPAFREMQKKKYGSAAAAPAPAGGDLAETLECIDDIIFSLRKSEKIYSAKIDQSQLELQDLDMQLKNLLLRRREATASDCLVLDGEIDSLYAKRKAVMNTISRFRQAKAINIEKEGIASQIKTQRDLQAINARAREMMGTGFANLEEYAMALRDAVQKGNEELERVGTANAVASGVDINMSTMSGRDAQASGEFEVKDEDKYRELEKELGIARE